MQTKEQGRRPKNWKVVAAIATASALGVSGLALAGPDDRSDDPDPIKLSEQTPITEVTVAKTTSTTLADLGFDVDTLDSASSPFDDSAAPTTTNADSVASVASAASPEPAPAPVPSADSPDPAPNPPADDSPDQASAQSAASAASADSADNSAGS